MRGNPTHRGTPGTRPDGREGVLGMAGRESRPGNSYTRVAYSRIVGGFRLEIEWATAKAGVNLRKHGVSFIMASTILRDPLAVTTFDDAHNGTEERWITIGRAVTGECLVVVHTWVENRRAHGEGSHYLGAGGR